MIELNSHSKSFKVSFKQFQEGIMSKRFRMSTALDVDDLLLSCIPYAIELANQKYQFNPPLSIYEVNHWGKLGTRADAIFEFFKDPDFYRNQPVLEGAKEFVAKLSKMTEVFISTSIPPEFMGIRAERILKEFPEIPETNIYMGSRKDKINVDILFDDGMHNVFKSNAAYPVLMRRPWNQNATGMLAVNTYDEFLKLVEVITHSYSAIEDKVEEPAIVILVGPSGSGKNHLAMELLKRSPKLEKLQCYTTKDPRIKYANDWYNYISLERFHEMKEDGEFFESTMYAGHGYGSRKCDVDAILAKGKSVLASCDICGAMSMKLLYPNAHTIYVKRNRSELLTHILKSENSIEEKVNRIIAIDGEKNNEEICDFEIKIQNHDYEKAASEVLEHLKF